MKKPSSNRSHYITNKSPVLSELKERWEKWELKNEEVLSEKRLLNTYIVFLHESEGYPKNQIAKLLDITRERVGQIIQYTKSKKGGGRS